jgi:3-deoxy-D-manno-octulosonic-acid transferase
MIFFYNCLQAVLLIITFPLLLLIGLGREKYRSRLAARLGISLEKKMADLNRNNKKIIWIHCLSVGEVTSALPLVKGIQENMDRVGVVFSASTSTGMKIALQKIKPHVDLVVAAPLDLLPVTRKFARTVRPDMFVLVETDFWPNWLHTLRQEGVPLVLVNGRISTASFARYRRFRFFFRPLFRSFSLLSMQTEKDAAQLRRLGVPPERIKTLGNLKYDARLFTDTDKGTKITAANLQIPEHCRTWVCGSTHPGEEEMIITAFAPLLRSRNDIFLILAPRDPGRSGEILKLIAEHGLRAMRRTRPADPPAPILLLDTIGELANCYRFAQAAFIGGSLVELGGHNPLEAAAHGIPVLFGPHMDYFMEIARDLIECGGAVTVASAAELEEAVRRIFEDRAIHQQMSREAGNLVNRNSGVVKRHIRELRSMLHADSGPA